MNNTVYIGQRFRYNNQLAIVCEIICPDTWLCKYVRQDGWMALTTNDIISKEGENKKNEIRIQILRKESST